MGIKITLPLITPPKTMRIEGVRHMSKEEYCSTPSYHRPSCANREVQAGSLRTICLLDQSWCEDPAECPYEIEALTISIVVVDALEHISPVRGHTPHVVVKTLESEIQKEGKPSFESSSLKWSGNKSHPLYRLWYTLFNGCTNEKHSLWVQYGAKGLKLYASWYNPTCFIEYWIDKGWNQGMVPKRSRKKIHFYPENMKLVPVTKKK